MTLNDLKLGDQAEIIDFTDDSIALLLNEMGFLLGSHVELTSVSPFGDPICIKSEETLLSLRRRDAHHIIIKMGAQ